MYTIQTAAGRGETRHVESSHDTHAQAWAEFNAWKDAIHETDDTRIRTVVYLCENGQPIAMARMLTETATITASVPTQRQMDRLTDRDETRSERLRRLAQTASKLHRAASARFARTHRLDDLASAWTAGDRSYRLTMALADDTLLLVRALRHAS
jgi:hypothetical protein